MEKNFRTRLFRLALITSPLIGIVNTTPLRIIAESVDLDVVTKNSFYRGAIAVSVVVFILWLINIALFHFNQKRGKPLVGWRIYILSYLCTFSFASLLYIVRSATEDPLNDPGLQVLPFITSFKRS